MSEEEEKKIIEKFERELEETKKEHKEDKSINLDDSRRCKFCYKEMEHSPARFISQDEFDLGRFEVWICKKCGFKIIEVFDNYSKLEYSEIQKYFGDKKRRISKK